MEKFYILSSIFLNRITVCWRHLEYLNMGYCFCLRPYWAFGFLLHDVLPLLILEIEFNILLPLLK